MPYRRQIALCRIALIYAALLGPPAIAQQQDVEEVLVSGSFIPDEKLDTSEVSEVMNADDMSIAGDSNIGDALKRLPGLSLVGGKFIYVRGLGERYSSTYFNGTLMPGIEPLKRAVPLDLFDASITSNVLVQKTFSTNYGAEFSGGVVDIRSAALPNESFFKIKYGTGYNSYSTGETSLGYAGGSEDWLGRDDGRRDLPRPLVETAGLYPNQFGSVDFGIYDIEQRDRARFSFSNNVWTVRPETAPYDQSFGLGGGLRLPLRDDLSLGVLAVLNYDHKTRNRFTERSRWGGGAFAPGFFQSDSQAKTLRDNALQFGDDKLDPADPADAYTAAKISSVSNYDRTVAEIGLTGLFAVGLEFRDVHNVK
ncbi:MAG: TonB-dependent receptor plug domain-containing protein, partial [Pseudomonadales bacterium]